MSLKNSCLYVCVCVCMSLSVIKLKAHRTEQRRPGSCPAQSHPAQVTSAESLQILHSGSPQCGVQITNRIPRAEKAVVYENTPERFCKL